MGKQIWIRTILAVFIATVPLVGVSSADITFSVTFTAQAQSDFSQAEQDLFTDALDFWDNIIVGHQDLQSRAWNLNVDTINQPASGGSVILGSAGPSALAFTEVVAGAATEDQRFVISTGGSASFNVNAAAGPLSFDTITHEIGHALGFGTLWEDNQVYNDGISGNSNRTLTGGVAGEYVGANALAAWQQEFVGQAGALFVPVELSGGLGTAHGHLDESDDFGRSPTGIVRVSDGRDLQQELLTGFSSGGPSFLSQTSIGSFQDIGFIVATAVPEPSSVVVLGSSGLLMTIRRRRRIS